MTSLRYWRFDCTRARDTEWATGLERAPPVCVQLSLIRAALSKPVAHSGMERPYFNAGTLPCTYRAWNDISDVISLFDK